MNAFVVIPYDLEKLKSDVLVHSKAESKVIVGVLYELSEEQIAALQQADTIYFVVSGTSMCSTAYQTLLFAAFPRIDVQRCRLLNLDGTRIPAGAPMLQTLPEVWPT